MLYQHKADPNVVIKNEGSLLYTASKNGHKECVKFLVEINCPIDELSTKYKVTALGIAAYSGYIDIVRFLNSKNASLTQSDPAIEYTPLLLACKTNQYEIVDYLLQFEEVRKHKVSYNNSPLVFCMLAKNEKLVSLLIKFKVNLLIENGKGENVLFLAVRNHLPMMVEIIYTHCKNLEIENHDGITPSMLSIMLHSFDITSIFIKLHANIQYRNSKGLTIKDLIMEKQDSIAIDYLNKNHLYDAEIENKYYDLEEYASEELNPHHKAARINLDAEKSIKIETKHGLMEIKSDIHLPAISAPLSTKHNSGIISNKKQNSPSKVRYPMTIEEIKESEEIRLLMKEVHNKFDSVLKVRKGPSGRSPLPKLSTNRNKKTVRSSSFEILKKKREHKGSNM